MTPPDNVRQLSKCHTQRWTQLIGRSGQHIELDNELNEENTHIHTHPTQWCCFVIFGQQQTTTMAVTCDFPCSKGQRHKSHLSFGWYAKHWQTDKQTTKTTQPPPLLLRQSLCLIQTMTTTFWLGYVCLPRCCDWNKCHVWQGNSDKLKADRQAGPGHIISFAGVQNKRLEQQTWY